MINARTPALMKMAVLISLIAVVSIPLFTSTPGVAEPLSEVESQQLAEQYAPVLQYSKDEPCYPVDVDYYLQSCSLYQVIDQNASLITETPTLAELAQLTTEDYFLSNRLGGVDDDNVIDAYQENLSRLGYTIYFNVQTEGQFVPTSSIGCSMSSTLARSIATRETGKWSRWYLMRMSNPLPRPIRNTTLVYKLDGPTTRAGSNTSHSLCCLGQPRQLLSLL